MMTRTEQIQFVLELSATITREVVGKLRNNKIPPDWDGYELRRYISDKFAAAQFKMDKSRTRKYNNVITTSGDL
jgi:hypothetical protein